MSKEELQSMSPSQILDDNSQNRQEIKEDEYPYSTSWFDMPEEMREMVINEIDPATTFRFKQCSRLCGEEARRSNNSMYKIELYYTDEGTHICFHLTDEKLGCPHFRYVFSENRSKECKTTTIRHEKMNIEDCSDSGYDDFLQKFKYGNWNSYMNSLSEEKWRIEENGDMKSVIVKYLKKFLEEYKYSLKAFIDWAYNFDGKHLNLKHLRHLQHIEFDNCDVLENNLMTFEQILKCRGEVWLRSTKFTFDQIIQLNADSINIGGKDLTNEQIKRYLKMWENWEVDENIGDIEIKLNGLEVLGDEYYMDGLLTVSKRDEHDFFILTRIPNLSTNYPQQCDITFWFTDDSLVIDRGWINLTKNG